MYFLIRKYSFPRTDPIYDPIYVINKSFKTFMNTKKINQQYYLVAAIAMSFFALNCFSTVFAEEKRSENIAIEALQDSKWFRGAKSKNGEIVLMQQGDILHQGIKSVLAVALKGEIIERTSRVGGRIGSASVEILPGSSGNKVIFRFHESGDMANPFKNEGGKHLSDQVKNLVSYCYWYSKKCDFYQIKNLVESKSISGEEALLKLMQIEYRTLESTYHFHNAYYRQWCKSNDVECNPWQHHPSFADFIKSDIANKKKKSWQQWLTYNE
jgi:hypothetical protein